MTEQNLLHQHGTLGALMAGLMDGTKKLADILSLGNFGIGTLHGLDGELIILDGKAYQGRSDGTLVELTGSELLPYAAVTNIFPEKIIKITEDTDSSSIKHLMEEKMESKNIFNAIKIHGTFNNMHIRIMPKQQRPYKRLIEVSQNQPEFTKENVTGTIVGFYTPELFQGVAAAGFHLHFLSDDHTFGGHILDFEIHEGMIELSSMDQLVQHFPTQNTEFLETEIDYSDLAAEIQAAEG